MFDDEDDEAEEELDRTDSCKTPAAGSVFVLSEAGGLSPPVVSK